MLLGLTGTLIGLGLAVTELSAMLSAQTAPTSQQIVAAILDTLGGMRVAFSTTLAGVLGAVFVGSGMALLRHEQSDVIRRLEQETSTEWAHRFRTGEQAKLHDAVNELEAINGVLRAGLKKLGKGFRKDSRALLGEVEKVRDATLKIIGERAENGLSLAQYVDTVKDTTTALQGAVDNTARLLPRIEAAILKAVQTERRELQAALTAHTADIRPMLEKQQQAAEALANAVRDDVFRLEQIGDVLERLNRSFEQARGTWEKADKSIEKMGRETATALRDGLQDTLAAVSRMTEEQARSQERVTTALDGFQGTYRDTMRMMSEQSARALNQSQEMVSEVRSTLQESLAQVGQRLVESQRGTTDQVATGLMALGRELRDLSAPTPARPTDRAIRVPTQSESTSRQPGQPTTAEDGRGRDRPSDSAQFVDLNSETADQVQKDLEALD